MTGRRSLGWTYNQAAKTKAAEALERSRREAAATAEMSRRAAEPSNELSRTHEGSHKCIRGVGHRDEPAFLKSFAGDDDILAGITTQQELVDGLMKLLEISDASVDKATGLVEQLMGENAKLLKALTDNAGNILTRQVLLERLWDSGGNFIDDHTLTVTMNRLRAKIEDEAHTYIKTVRGIGYVWTGGRP